MNVAQMKEYLKNICVLEGNVYGMQRLRSRLQYEVNSLKNYAGEPEIIIPTQEYTFSDAFEMIKAFSGGGIGLGAIGAIVAVIFFDYRPILSTVFIKGPIIGCIIGVVVAVIWSYVDKKCIEKENHDNLQREVEENNRIRRNNDIERQARNQKANIIQKEINILEQNIDKTRSTLAEYYNKNIIYRKYWNYVAVASFLEYFDSGRCTVLEGHEGAYNLFENEIRQNMIIEKLDEVIQRLDEIKNNQYILYSEIQKQNQTVNRITSTVKSCANTLTSLEKSNQIIEYNSQITASNTELFKWLTILS